MLITQWLIIPILARWVSSTATVTYQFPADISDEFAIDNVYRRVVKPQDDAHPGSKPVDRSWFKWAIENKDESVQSFLYPSNSSDRPWDVVPLARVYIRNARIVASFGRTSLRISDSISEINAYLSTQTEPPVDVDSDIASYLSSRPNLSPVAAVLSKTIAIARIMRSSLAPRIDNAFDTVVLHPRKDHRATVFVFHCLTGKASWMDEMARKSWVPTSLGDHVKFVFVDAGDSHSWFNLDANALSVATKLVAGSGEFVDRSSLDASMARVVQMIDAEAALVPGAHASIYLVGLSQGGMLALWTGLMGGIRQLGGVAVMNTIFPVHNVGSSVLHPDLPVAHFHGALDTTLPRPLAGYRKRRAELAGARNYRIATVWGGHWPSTQCKDAIGGWLQSRIL